jgi:hypothetical protein
MSDLDAAELLNRRGVHLFVDLNGWGLRATRALASGSLSRDTGCILCQAHPRTPSLLCSRGAEKLALAR